MALDIDHILEVLKTNPKEVSFTNMKSNLEPADAEKAAQMAKNAVAKARLNAKGGESVFHFPAMIEKLKKSPKTIVFPEGCDKRIQEAACRLLQDSFLKPILLGNPDEVKAAAKAGGFNLDGAVIIDPLDYPDIDRMAQMFMDIRKGKIATLDDAKKMLKGSNYFGTMLVKMGMADALLGGATYSTADTIRPALQIVKTRPGSSLVGSVYVMVRSNPGKEKEVLLFSDCVLNIDPTDDDLVEICHETAAVAPLFGVDPKIAFLSYSTKGSGKGPSVDKMRSAAEKTKAKYPDLKVEGEIQFDAAVDEGVGQQKAPGSPVAGYANTFIFPDINAGNIGYKIAARLGGFEAIGPVLTGLNGSLNDLSRGCNADEVYAMSIITAAMA